MVTWPQGGDLGPGGDMVPGLMCPLEAGSVGCILAWLLALGDLSATSSAEFRPQDHLKS